MSTLTFKFEGPHAEELMKDFMSWMCDEGEQDYWNHLEFQDDLPDDCDFKYDFTSNEVTVR